MTEATTLTPVLTKNWDAERSWSLATYLKNGGYRGLRAALAMAPAIASSASRSGCGPAHAVAPIVKPSPGVRGKTWRWAWKTSCPAASPSARNRLIPSHGKIGRAHV